MHALIGFILSVTFTLTLGGLALAVLAGRRRSAFLMTDGELRDDSPQVGSPRNDAGQRAKSGEIIDTDTQAAMAEVMAVYGATGPFSQWETEPEILPGILDEAPIVRLANTILQQAIKERASEIHLEADVRGMRVRYRIDGVLHEIWQMPNYIKAPLTGRYKVLACVNLLEHRLPQTGQIGSRFQGKTYDLNVCFLPTRYGVTTTIRIFDHSSVRGKLDKLGLMPKLQSDLEEIVTRPTGLLLVTGPDGSGRGTLAYNLLDKLNTVERNIMTIEERPGFQISGLTQVYLDRQAGCTLPSVMTALRQHTPDVIFIGVDTDPETLRIALEAAQNHLVIATMNAADTQSALLSLMRSVRDSELVATTLSGIVALRLGRCVCRNCKETHEVPGTELHRFGYTPEDAEQPVQLVRGTGCEACRNSGYRGRIGIHELLRNSPSLAEQIARQESFINLHLDTGSDLTTFRQDALSKILEGITTPEEMLRILPTNY